MKLRPTRRGCLLLLLAPAAAALGLYLWLRGPGLRREAARLAAVLELRPGAVAADIGAGKGRLAVQMARRLGPSGRVYATEVEADKLEAIRRAAAESGLGNVTVVPAGQSTTGLPEGCCDALYLRRVYHHLSEPAAMARAFQAALRPGGRVAVIDFRFLGHGVEAETVVAQMTAAGFALDRRIGDWSPIDYCLVFRPPAPRRQ